MEQTNIIVVLKNEIRNAVETHNKGICDLCDQLIKNAITINDTESIVFGYVCKADYYYETSFDPLQMFVNLQEASKYIDEKVATVLLEKYYMLYHCYYHSFSDIASSLNYCLKALHVAECLHDENCIVSNLATIGKLYISYDQYEKALFYLNKALHVCCDHKLVSNFTVAAIVISKFDCLVHLNRFDEAKEMLCFMKSEFSQWSNNVHLHRCQMIYYSYLRDEEKTLFYAIKILKDTTIMEQPFAYDILSNVYHAMMRILKETYAKQALTMLYDLKLDTSHMQLKIALYQVEFDKQFDPQSLFKDYIEYYRLYKMHEKFLDQEKIKAYDTKIMLHEAFLQKEKMQLERKKDKHYIDEQTKVHNHMYLNFRKMHIISDKNNTNIGYIIFDVDYFREYNDFYGQIKGDEVLKIVAQLLKDYAETNMDICRYDSDQFVCLCHNCDRKTITSYIENVRSALFKKHLEHKPSICSDRITLSIGYGVHDLPIKHNIFSFVKDTECALYQAKQNGRNTVVALMYEDEHIEDENIYLSQSNQVLHLVQDIKAIRFQDLGLLKQKCDSLATIAEKNNDLYGVAFSHMYLAHYYQINQKDDAYKFHSEKAKKMSIENQFLDILAEYYKLACIYFTESGYELSSFSSCLDGLRIGEKANDYEACAAFYNNVAEAYFQSGAYDKAEVYYLKALENTTHATEERPKYKDLVLMNLVDVFMKQKDVEKSNYWLEKSQSYGQDTSLIATYSKRSEICIFVLEGKIQEAFLKIKKLRKELEIEEPMLFIHIYLYLMDILLDMKQSEYAYWCLHLLLSLIKDVNMQFKLQIYTFQIMYQELFDIQDIEAYAIFYDTSIRYTENENKMHYEVMNEVIEKHNAKLKVEVNLQKDIYKDDITGVYNRDYFLKILTKMMYSKTIKTLGIIIFDIDYFRQYNSTYGYSKGDELLNTIAHCLLKVLPSDDLVFLFGKDKFACICTNKSDKDMIHNIENVQMMLKDMHIEHKTHKCNNDKYVTMSFGFYNGMDRINILEKAEDALSKAKIIGRNTYYPHKQKEENTQYYMQFDATEKEDYITFISTYNKVLETDQAYALIQINIKKFRYFNTKYGYKEGDEILSLVYNKIIRWLEEGEYAVHMYADNYAVLVKYDDINTLLNKRLTKNIEMLERIKDPRIHHNLFLTYGVYEMKDKSISFQEAWNAANLVRKETTSPTKRSSSLGLYQQTYQNAFLERIQLEVDTAEAYNNFEFIPFYQPKVDPKTHEIIGAEALLRWYDANGNLVPLYKFLPILNENSYIIRIDLAIFETTCKMLDERIKAGRPVVPISFNISKSYFYEDSLIEDYVRVFRKYNIPANLIEFELMETISLDDTERLKKVIQGFKNYEFKCMLDDFGNGYSSFNVLLTNDLYAVKIDRQFFLKNLNGDNKLIIETVINLIKSLHMKVIAEGVETKEYVDFLADCDCDAIQGYYFYKPMPLKKFYTLINRVK